MVPGRAMAPSHQGHYHDLATICTIRNWIRTSVPAVCLYGGAGLNVEDIKMTSVKLRTASASAFLLLSAAYGSNAFDIFRSDDGTFQIEFPDKPMLEDLSVTNVPMRYWNVEKDDKFWSAGYSELPTIRQDLIRLETLN